MMAHRSRYGKFIGWVFSIVDFILFNAAYFCTYWFNASADTDLFWSKKVWVILNIAFFITHLAARNVHTRNMIYADRLITQAFKTVLFCAIIFFALVTFVVDVIEVPWLIWIKFYILFFALLCAWWLGAHRVLKNLRAKGFNFRHIIIIGGGNVGQQLMAEFNSNQGYGYHILGFFDNDVEAHKGEENYAGTLNDVANFAAQHTIDEMYCAVPDTNEKEVERMISIACHHAIDFYYIPQLGNYVTRSTQVDSIGDIPVMAIRPYPLSNLFNRMLKRLFDFVFSSIALIFSPILFIPVAIGIKISSPGPVFFKQKRTGYRGKPFTCYKFRSMKVNADSDRLQATDDDPRKTKFGDFLRRSSIDELPQFFNVWKGDMSIVGPRPHMVQQTEMYSKLINNYMLRHTIKPGITGLAQIKGFRGVTDKLWKMDGRVKWDVWYAEHWSFMLDLKIIFLTIADVVRGDKNAV